MSRSMLALCSLMFLATACAETATQVRSDGPRLRPTGRVLQAAAADPQGTWMVCDMESPTGSHIRTQVCRSRERMEQDRAMLDDLLVKLRRPKPIPLIPQ